MTETVSPDLAIEFSEPLKFSSWLVSLVPFLLQLSSHPVQSCCDDYEGWAQTCVVSIDPFFNVLCCTLSRGALDASFSVVSFTSAVLEHHFRGLSCISNKIIQLSNWYFSFFLHGGWYFLLYLSALFIFPLSSGPDIWFSNMLLYILSGRVFCSLKYSIRKYWVYPKHPWFNQTMPTFTCVIGWSCQEVCHVRLSSNPDLDSVSHCLALLPFITSRCIFSSTSNYVHFAGLLLQDTDNTHVSVSPTLTHPAPSPGTGVCLGSHICLRHELDIPALYSTRLCDNSNSLQPCTKGVLLEVVCFFLILYFSGFSAKWICLWFCGIKEKRNTLLQLRNKIT